MDLAAQLAQRLFSAREGVLQIGGVDLLYLARHYGTPFYVYDAALVRAALANLRAALPAFDCLYSVKANPNPSLLRLLLAEGCGLEVASQGELRLALACGCPPARIAFAGPGKTDLELRLALTEGVGLLHVESIDEILRLGRLAETLDRKAQVSLRINPAIALQSGAQKMGGKPTAFGIDEEELEQALAALFTQPRLSLAGIHVFSGTQLLEASAFAPIYQCIIGIASRTARLAGRPLAHIDFGGGFGIPYFPGEKPLDLETLRAQVAPLVDTLRADPLLREARLLVEPGRYLTAESGLYVTSVTRIKSGRGKSFAILDGGLSHHLPASGNLGQVLRRNFPILAANHLGEPVARAYELCGPLCTPLDLVGRDIPLPELRPGDLIAILQSGAYCRTTSPHGFLSHPSPQELLIENGAATQIRRRGDMEELLRGTVLGNC